jgi:penicillin-binding protein 1B
VAINRITTGEGVTIAAPTAQRTEVLRPDVAYVMNSFMKDVVNRGTAAKVRARGLKANVAGKTGTSRDGWFAGFTPNLVCVVWVGFDDGSQLGLTGANSALPIWTDFMQVALSEHPEWQGDWQMPEGIQQAEIDTKTGQLTTPDNPNRRTELFINGTLPAPTSTESPEEEATPYGLTGEGETIPEAVDPGPTPQLAPTPTPRPRPTPRAGEEGARLEGSITLDIDPGTGLIAVETCPVIRTKTFVIGTEPRTYCGPEHHRGKTVDPASSRPRVVATPRR